jgi:hypothetical protein
MGSDSALRAALEKLLAQGEQVSDNSMLQAHAAKNAPPPEACPECKVPLVDGKCAQCGYAPADESADMSGLQELGAEG